MQPAYTRSGAGGHSHKRDGGINDYDVPRLGEIPVRSKYYRPDQEKSHFANHPTYLPLAEQCGPPQPSSSTSLTPHQERHQKYGQSNDDEVGGHAYDDMGEKMRVKNDDYEQAQQMHHNSHPDCLRESSVSGSQGSGHCIQTASIGSNASGASSIGPTGLPLMPQFRWIPKQGGGGLGFNPFVHFRSRTRHEGMASSPSAPGTDARMPWNEAQQKGDYGTPELPCGATSPEHQQRHNEDQSQTPGCQNSYSIFYGCTPQPPAQQSTPPTRCHRETGALSFYGPIGSIGIETSRKRRAVERQSGTDGEAERAYKERSSRRPVEGEETGVQLLTQLWCDVSLLHGALVVDSPRLPPDDGEGDDSASTSSPSIGDREVDEAAMAARKKVCQRRQQYSSRSPSFYFKDDDLAALGAEDNGSGSPSGAAARVAAAQKPVTVRAHHQQHIGPPVVKTTSPAAPAGDQREVGSVDKVAARGVAGHEVASSSSSFSSGSSDNDSSDDDSNSDEGSAGERSACFGSDGDGDESVDSDDADNPRSDDKDAAAGSTHPRRWKQRFSANASAGTGRSALRDGQYDFMNSSLMDESFMSRMPGCGPGMSLLYAHDDYDGGGEAAAGAADLVPNRAPHHVGAESAGIAGTNIAAHTPTLPSIPPQPQEHRGSSSIPVARGSAVRPSGSGTAATLALRGQRRVSNATDTRTPSGAAARHTPHQGGDAGGPSNHNAGGGIGGCGLGEQFVYGSSFGMGSRRNSYSATACDETHNAAFTSLGVYWVTKGNGNTVSPGTSVVGGDDEPSAVMGVYSDSREDTVSLGLLGVTSRGPTAFPAVDDGCTAKACNSTSQPSKLPLTHRGIANPATRSRPPNTAQGIHKPVVPTSSQQPACKVKAVYPGGYLAPITPPATPKANEAPLPRCAQRNNGGASTLGPRGLANASTTPGLGDTVGGKSFTSLAYELPGI
ncbi:hypothetical protein, unknown function [Leishmania mexicana MHOM/GT/2001/U1103]|uniref:Uncharacterized protein n=1 Tax=Leishmania mexicana (strain MHOM/GT/2001/U1103) TaxID=929439 RepID=E9AUP3_LEIMU|nr:hypothetical protein, unknown function [Leishmania mexicana MHOM/GT/2001/U1103]CBZ26672.1 hypothetical protein, unknown function [Leishmania mexicana MHOM/GT/2001/U1103]